MALTRKQFNAFIRKLSAFNAEDNHHYCRVEICLDSPSDWRVVTDICKQEENVSKIHKALADILFIYVSENHPNARVKDCRVLGEPSGNALTEGMRVWT